MKKRRTGVLLIILGVILAAAVGGTTWWFSRSMSTQTKTEMTSVVVAVQEIPARMAIQQPNLVVKNVPAELVPAGAAKTLDQVVGKMAMERIFANEVVLTAKIADTKGANGIAYTIEKGNVVITYPASDIVGTGAVRAGDCVDLLVTLRPSDKQGDANALKEAVAKKEAIAAAVTQVTLQNLKVLAIGSVNVPDGSNQNNQKNNANQLITFSVTPQDALILKALKDTPEAVLEIVLRAAGDDTNEVTTAVTIKDLIAKYNLSR